MTCIVVWKNELPEPRITEDVVRLTRTPLIQLYASEMVALYQMKLVALL